MRISFLFLASIVTLTIVGLKAPSFEISLSGKKSLQKTVLISGATAGIGLATAQLFQKNGWKVWAGYHKQVSPTLKTVPNIRLCHLDVTDDASIQAAVAEILKEDGRVDALINNAGYGLIGAEECVTIEEVRQQFEVNFFGVLRLIQAVLPIMRAAFLSGIFL